MSDQLYDAYDDACNRVREQDAEIAALKARIALLEAVAEAAEQEEETAADANQFMTQQARIAKRAALRAAGYLKEQGEYGQV